MDSIVYAESPLAQYLEGQGLASQQYSPHTHPNVPPDDRNFAPRQPTELDRQSLFPHAIMPLLIWDGVYATSQGMISVVAKIFSSLSKDDSFEKHWHHVVHNDTVSSSESPKRKRASMRNFSALLDMPHSPDKATRSTIQDPISATFSSYLTGRCTEKFLDRFRFLVMTCNMFPYASSFSGARQAISAAPGSELVFPPVSPYGLSGAIMILMLSFLSAGVLRLAFSLSIPWAVIILSAGAFILWRLLELYIALQLTQRLHQSAGAALESFTTQSHLLDSVVRSVLEICLETPHASQKLSLELTETLSPISKRLLDSHFALMAFIDPIDMQKCHDSVELSWSDYEDAINGCLPDSPTQEKTSQALQEATTRLATARQIFSCDLLALQSVSMVPEFRRWPVITSKLLALARLAQSSSRAFNQLLSERVSVLTPPVSPTSSSGGMMAGDSPTSPSSVTSVEVFEAYALPRRSKRWSLTKEEKVEKLEEARRKRESREATVGMLRELETVLKHRQH